MSKIKNLIKKFKLDYIILAIIMSIYYGYIQWNNFVGDPDGFYHAKLAKWLAEGKLIESLPWMQFSSLRNDFTDHHLLYHLLLAPFTIFFDPMIGVKIATVIFAVAMVLTFYWFLKRFNIPWPFIFATSFLILNGFNFRASLIKANTLSVLMLYLIVYALFKQKYWLSTLLSAMFIWLYGGWPLAILILITYLISYKIYKKLNTNKLKIFLNKSIELLGPFQKKYKLLKTSLYLLGGLALGLIINPYWPKNLYFYYQQVLQIGIINMSSQFNVGNEWYGADMSQIIFSSPHLSVIAIIAIMVLSFNIKKISHLTWFAFLMSLGFFILTIKSKRYIEYYMPFTILFIASASKDIKEFIDWSKYLKTWKNLSQQIRICLTITALLFLTITMPFAYDSILNVSLRNKYPIDKFQTASLWLKENTEANSIVFHSDWDEWPILFYNNDHNYYIIGLDPTFMENYNPQLHKLYREITYGNIRYNISKYIKNDFKADYIFVDRDGHENFIQNLILDKGVSEVYQDNKTIIYKIIL
ncbi:MAG: hypothetical protein WC664_01640 [Patescibacteria group bacterium]|jgi:hypothetical protein